MRTELTLDGLERSDLPVRVLPRQAQRPIPGDVSLWFIGPHMWHVSTFPVTGPSEPCRIIASARSRAWISKNLVQLAGSPVTAAMIPACRLQIVWPIPEGGARSGCTVSVRHELETNSVVLVPRLLPRPGGSRAELHGSLVVALGPVEATCWSASGERLWQRAINTRDGFATIEIEADTPR